MIENDICQNNHKGNLLSEQAYNNGSSRRKQQRRRIVEYLQNSGNSTCDEAEVALDMVHQTCSARFSELKRDQVIIPVFDGEKQHTRLTRNNKSAGVFRLNPEGGPWTKVNESQN